MSTRIPGLLVVGLLAGPMTAVAAPITGSFSFVASGFGAGAPSDPVTGWVSYSFDDAAPFLNAKNGDIVNGAPVQVSVSGLSLPGSWVPVLTFNPPFAPGILAVGHVLSGTVVNPGTDDWRVAVNNILTNPTFREFTYASSSIAGATFVTTNGRVAAPEPATLALLGLGVVGVALKRRGTESGS